MHIIHGRKGHPTEYLQVNMQQLTGLPDDKSAVVVQKSGQHWVLYLLEGGGNDSVITVDWFETSEDARAAVEIAANAIAAYRRLK